MKVLALALMALTGSTAPPVVTGPISVEVTAAKEGTEDILALKLRNNGNRPVTIELSESPCSSIELATVAFQGDGAIGRPLDRVGLIEDVLMREHTIAAKGTYSCTFSISRWYWQRWKPEDRSKIKIFWSFESKDGVYEKPLYGGVVKLP